MHLIGIAALGCFAVLLFGRAAVRKFLRGAVALAAIAVILFLVALAANKFDEAYIQPPAVAAQIAAPACPPNLMQLSSKERIMALGCVQQSH